MSQDALGRTPISDAVKQNIADAFRATDMDGKRGALLIIADENGARAMLAARIGNNWKVAAGAGKPWEEKHITGSVAIMGSW